MEITSSSFSIRLKKTNELAPIAPKVIETLFLFLFLYKFATFVFNLLEPVISP